MAHSPQSSLGTDDDFEDVGANLGDKEASENPQTDNPSLDGQSQDEQIQKDNENGNGIENEAGERTERSRTIVFRESFDADSVPKAESLKKKSTDGSSPRKGRTESVFSGNDTAILTRIKTSYGLGGSIDATGTALEEAIQQEVAAANIGGPPISPDVPPPMTAEEELEFRQDLEEQILNAFRQHMPNPDEDADIEEFIIALKSMKCELEEPEMKKLFKFADVDREDYVSKEDICTFLMKEYASPELQRLKKCLLTAIMGSEHKKEGSGLLKCDETRWPQAKMSFIGEEMKEALIVLATQIDETVTKEKVFEEEYQKMLDDDPTAFKLENVKKWKVHQVVHWLIQNDMKQYTKAFYEQEIDGDILLNDITDSSLMDLGLKVVHIGQFKRKLKELKKVVREMTDILLEEQTCQSFTFLDVDKQNELRTVREQLAFQLQKNTEMEKELEVLRRQVSEYKEAFQAYKDSGMFGLIGDIPSSNATGNRDSLTIVDGGNEPELSVEPALSINSMGSQSYSNLAAIPQSDIIANGRLVNMVKQKKENSPIENKFGDIERVSEWNNEEVAYWLVSINFPQYALSFYNVISDGEMLLHDVNMETLKEDLKVRRIHSRRILQQIQQLKRKVIGHWDTDIFEHIHIEPASNRPTQSEIDKLRQQLETLQKEQDQLLSELENGLSADDMNEDGNDVVSPSGELSNGVDGSNTNTDANTNGDMETKENELTQSAKTAPSAKGAKKFLSNKITALRAEKDEIKQQLEALQHQHKDTVSANEAKMDEMNTKIANLEQRNTQLTQELDIAQTRLKQLTTEHEELKKVFTAKQESDAAKGANQSKTDEEQKHVSQENDIDVNEIVQKVKNMADRDPQFATPANAMDWTQDEVCYWLYQMQVEVYIPRFIKMGIDGNILIADVNEKWLREDLSIAKLHVTKILRELEKLRAHGNKSGHSVSTNSTEQQTVQILELTKQLKEERELTQAYETEIAQLKAELETNDPITWEKKLKQMESLIDFERKKKVDSLNSLTEEINSYRVATKIMQQDINWLREQTNKHPLDMAVGILGYKRA